MNKSDLIATIASEMHTSKLAANRVLDTVLGSIQKGLIDEGTVTITGFGTFEVKERKPRIGRNPHTGEPIQIQAGRRIGFRVGKGLKQLV
ncbi:MAG TPA: HU family DNA-binding protein [Planctomycetes bacterium]|nr:HU family DNA-binding protein [Planctomycetota bacterium]